MAMISSFFMLYDLWRTRHEPGRELGHLYGIETRADLVSARASWPRAWALSA